jgi:site-specific recombinase XerD
MAYPIIKVVFDRKKQATTRKEGLVQVEIYHEKVRRFISTGVKVYSDQWDKKVYVRNRKDALLLNEQIMETLNKIRDTANEVVKTSGDFYMDKFEAIFKTDKAKTDSFLDFMREKIDERMRKGEITKSTAKQHMVSYYDLVEFGLIQTFQDLNPSNISRYEIWINNKGRRDTTQYNFIKRLKVYVTMAKLYGHIKDNPFEGRKYSKGKSKGRKYLTEDELRSLKEVELDDTLTKVRDSFLFMCYTSLAYSDAVKFDFKRDVVEKNGKFMFQDTRQKTDEEYFIVLIPAAMELLRKYDYKIPFFANQRMNDYLKVIAQFAKIRKPISTHYARHTAACLALNNGVRIETVSRMLGHSNIKTTQIYAKMLTDEVEKAYDKVSDIWDNI